MAEYGYSLFNTATQKARPYVNQLPSSFGYLAGLLAGAIDAVKLVIFHALSTLAKVKTSTGRKEVFYGTGKKEDVPNGVSSASQKVRAKTSGTTNSVLDKSKAIATDVKSTVQSPAPTPSIIVPPKDLQASTDEKLKPNQLDKELSKPFEQPVSSVPISKQARTNKAPGRSGRR